MAKSVMAALLSALIGFTQAGPVLAEQRSLLVERVTLPGQHRLPEASWRTLAHPLLISGRLEHFHEHRTLAITITNLSSLQTTVQCLGIETTDPMIFEKWELESKRDAIAAFPSNRRQVETLGKFIYSPLIIASVPVAVPMAAVLTLAGYGRGEYKPEFLRWGLVATIPIALTLGSAWCAVRIVGYPVDLALDIKDVQAFTQSLSRFSDHIPTFTLAPGETKVFRCMIHKAPDFLYPLVFEVESANPTQVFREQFFVDER